MFLGMGSFSHLASVIDLINLAVLGATWPAMSMVGLQLARD